MKGKSEGDPANSLDSADAYQTLNLFAGFCDPEGAWLITFFGKNITNTEKVLVRNANREDVGYTLIDSGLGTGVNTSSSATGVSDYRVIKTTPEREFGVRLSYAFGSREKERGALHSLLRPGGSHRATLEL